jgi:starch-binding outer membrane protein, SusD/RagB family
MKNKFLIAGIVLTTLVVSIIISACNKLNLTPLDKTTAATFYKTTADFDAAIFAAYSSMQDMWVVNGETGRGGGDGWGAFWAISMAPTDDVKINSLASTNGSGMLNEARKLDNMDFNTTNSHIYTLYSQVYEGIARANLVLENVNNGSNSLTDDEKTKFTAEAKFIRGFFHFIAAQIWKTAPLVTETPKSTEGLTYSNSDPAALLAACAADFKDASDGLPSSWDAANTGRATKWCAKAFQGKVHVWEQKWNEAVDAFEQAEANGSYQLLPDYEDAFAYAKENSNESVFEVQYGGPYSDDNGWVYDDNHSESFKASQGIARNWFFYTNDAFGSGGGSNSLKWYVPTQSLKTEFESEPGDNRLAASLYYIPGEDYTSFAYSGPAQSLVFDPASSETGLAIKKYFGSKNVDPNEYKQNVQFNNERFFRFSEVLLLHAEALINGGTPKGQSAYQTAASCVNATRQRAGLTAVGSVTLAQLQSEKRKELAFEPARYFDMIRWNIGGAKILPFPQAEIDRNQGSLVQNP